MKSNFKRIEISQEDIERSSSSTVIPMAMSSDHIQLINSQSNYMAIAAAAADRVPIHTSDEDSDYDDMDHHPSSPLIPSTSTTTTTSSSSSTNMATTTTTSSLASSTSSLSPLCSSNNNSSTGSQSRSASPTSMPDVATTTSTAATTNINGNGAAGPSLVLINANNQIPTVDVSTLLSHINQLNTWVAQIDQCSPTARSIVWRQLNDICMQQAYPNQDISTLHIANAPLWESKCTDKFLPYFHSLLRKPNMDVNGLQSLHCAFVESERRNTNLFQQCSPQTAVDPTDDQVTINPYTVSSDIFHSSSIWGFTLPSVLQQLLCLTAWAPQLDRLPTNLRKAIWDNCLSFAPFKTLTVGTKLNSFTKVVKGWTNHPINNMLAITTLFGSLGYLTSRRVLSNNFYFPQTNYLVFSFNESDYVGSSSSSQYECEDEVATSPSPLKKNKKSHSTSSYKQSDMGERVPSMSPLPTIGAQSSATPGYASPMASYSTLEHYSSDTESSFDSDPVTPTKHHSSSSSNQQQFTNIESISSMIDKVMRSKSLKPSSNTQSTATKQPTSSLSLSSSSAFNNTNTSTNKQSKARKASSISSYSVSNNNYLFTNTNTNSNNLHHSSDSVPFVNNINNSVCNIPTMSTQTKQMDAMSMPVQVPVNNPMDGCAPLDVLVMTAFQFEELDESIVCQEPEVPKRETTSFKRISSRKRRLSSEHTVKQEGAMNINNILCS
ncbi:hypothetical protein SAMD00019534_122670 [Acytostelium subglobosum LB1]|uniref:hypothetical protein n=1 Tax=Acytostelium subglobosum LB1 TaxID=1410327 RepID=UPI000644F224|nr:hypothetical protein SAMD00019534_122670 [Acytostelium subglobosum LB1]GAM29091.1 hypothetical protein SAMD00019534_122670 [Acytostelium subglobosum LB1]|eukprot:XP_012747936.1 hypothetical protein SAMD00019534_122670 [Acytostelium subglobosum LB1]